MSLFRKIGKGIKKLTLKKALPYVAGVAALAVPGVGSLALKGASMAGKGIVTGGLRAGKLAGGLVHAGTQTVSGLAGAARDTASTIAADVTNTASTVADARGRIIRDTTTAGAAANSTIESLTGQNIANDMAGAAGASAASAAFKQATPFLIGGAVLLVLVLLMRRK